MGGKGRTRAKFDWGQHVALSERWREGARSYCAAINAFVAKGEADGWDAAGDEPKDGRTEAESAAVLDIVRNAQPAEDGNVLRELFPPGFAVLVARANEVGKWIGPVVYVAPDVLMARLGDPWGETRMWAFTGAQRERHEHILVVGRSPRREIVAVGHHEGVSLSRGWNEPTIAVLPWPNGSEGLPKDLRHETYAVPGQIDELIPFDDGERAVPWRVTLLTRVLGRNCLLAG